MKYLKILKSLFLNFIHNKDCEHDYQTITNLYGKDVIRIGFVKYRSVRKCKHCGFVVYSTEKDKECNIINRKYKIYK